MKTFKTAKGTELPLRDMRGKDYLEVPYRVLWMREEHPEWGIETEYLQLGADLAIAKATVRDGSGKILAQGTKTETPAGFADYVEKAETGAIGRALALCGYGTQFAHELEEGERIVDSPREIKSNSEDPGAYVVKVGTHKDKRIDSIQDLGGWVGFHGQNKKLTGPMLEAVEMGKKFLAAKNQ